jgi:hypothetical protein
VIRMSGKFVCGLVEFWWSQGYTRYGSPKERFVRQAERGVGSKLMQGGQEPGRGIYALRRIVAVLVVLLLLALVGFWAWQNLFRPGEQGSKAPEITNVGSTEVAEEPATEESAASGTEEIAVSEEGPSERSEGSVRVSTEGGAIGSISAVNLAAATLPRVPTPQAVLPPPAPSSGISPPATQVPPVPPVAQAPSTAPVPNVVPTTNPPQEVVQPVPLEEPVPFLEPVAFEEEVPFSEAAFEAEDVSGGATATAGGAVAIAGSGAAAGSGAVATVG